MLEPVDKRTDLVVAFGLIIICAAFLYETFRLPPGTFEPLGSAPVPQATASCIILLCLAVIVQALRRPDGVEMPRGERYLDAAIIVGLTLLYATVVHMRLATFAILTTVYLLLAIGWLVRFKPRQLPAVILTAAIVGFGCQYIFTRVFVVDLPGL